MKVQTIKHADVRGKELNYIKLSSVTGKEYLINVGDKTWTAVMKLLEEEEIQIIDPTKEDVTIDKEKGEVVIEDRKIKKRN